MKKTPPAPFQSFESLADRAYIAIEEMIMTAELPPNAFVSETALAEHTGIGRTPVREALKRLAADGLVLIVPSRGIQISEIDLRQQLLLLEVRRELERLVAMRAARRATPEERELFSQIAMNMRAAAAADNGEQFMRYDQEFNQLLDQAARNPFAIQAMRPLRSMSRRFWFQNYSRQQDSLEHGSRTHTAVMDAIAKGDEEQAGEAMDRLMDYVEDFARATLHRAI